MEITDKLLAAYAKGDVSVEERLAVRHHLAENPEDLLAVFDVLDEDKDLYDLVCPNNERQESSEECSDYGRIHNRLRKLTQEIEEKSKKTLFAVAADNTIDNLCDIRCEGYALRTLGVEVSDSQLEQEARENGWLIEEGTRLMNVGRLCELHGIRVTRQLESTIADLEDSLNAQRIVIVSVDEGELVGDLEIEVQEDLQNGRCPDHVVIVSSYDKEDNTVTLIDPNTPQINDTYQLDRFMDAWDDSRNYMISIG